MGIAGLRIWLLGIATCLTLAAPAWGVILASDTGYTTNTTPGSQPDLTAPGFANVGQSSTRNASVIYLGNRWALTANHVTIANVLATDPGTGAITQFGSIKFGDHEYQVVSNDRDAPGDNLGSAITWRLHNPDTTAADLKLFRLTTDPLLDNPGLADITPELISSTTPSISSQVIMAGNGLTSGPTQNWTLGPTTHKLLPYYYTENNDANGADRRIIRWGENNVIAHPNPSPSPLIENTHVFVTRLDSTASTGVAGLANEAHGSNGDSGGAVFSYQDNVWKLSGVMIDIDNSWPTQPANTVLFGSHTYIADLSVYRDEILTIIPEPSGLALGLLSSAGFLGVLVHNGRHRKPLA